MSVLCFSVTLLDGRYHGRADAGEPEWPPSPWRLFQALLAGAHTGSHHAEWSKNGHANAFLWLERREPPLIIAPERRELSAYRISVPNNDMDTLAAAWAKGTQPRKTPAELRTMKTLRPSACADDGPMIVRYLYGLEDDEHAAAEVTTLCQVARCLHTLGWGIDAAIASARVLGVEEVAQLPGVRWRPQKEGAASGQVRRVPMKGSLDDLTECHKQFAERIPGGKTVRQPKRPNVFHRVAYLSDADVALRPFAAFLLRRMDDPDGWQPFRQEEANIVAAMLRSLTCRLAQRDSHGFPNGSELYVAGHKENASDDRPRFSYMVLPTIGHPHADGMIRRVLIAEPHGGDETHAQWARNRLRGRTVTDNAERPKAVLQATGEHESVVRLYVGESRSWSTVTPVILPGYDDRSQLKAERLLPRAIERAGIPVSALCDLTLRKAPFWPGSLHPGQYQRPNYLGHLPAWHLHLRFREPVTGPLALGAGRHCGLGIFAAEGESSP